MDRDFSENREELQSLRRGWSAFAGRRLVLWLIRWTIGFTLIGLVAALCPEMSWLWWVGIGFAILTPFTAMACQWLVSRKIREAETALADLEETMPELED